MARLTKLYLDELTYRIIGAVIEVHKTLGPGLLEKIYETCLEAELLGLGLKVARQQTVPIHYKGLILDAELRYDLLVEDCILLELKAVEQMHPVYEAQILSYMKLLKIPKGILVNFTCSNIFKDGQKTFVNEFFRDLPDS